MVVVWPPRWRSEQRVSGSAPDFSLLRRRQSILNINVGSLPPPRTTPPIAKNLFDGGWANAPHRVLRNSTVRDWEAAGRPPSGQRPGEGAIIARSPSRGEADRYRSYTPGPDTVGEIEPLSLWSGQGVALVRKVQPAAEIVREMNDNAKVILSRLASNAHRSSRGIFRFQLSCDSRCFCFIRCRVLLRVSDAGRSQRCGLHRGRRPKAAKERTRGKLQAVARRAPGYGGLRTTEVREGNRSR